MPLELLAPAGSPESLKMAVLYGADAVYLGCRDFSMRAGPENFTPLELYEAVAFAHEHGVKVYLTCNIIPTNGEAERFPAFITEAQKTGIDAVIVADLGMLEAVKTHAPKLNVHISTQAGIINFAAANAFHKLGAKRVILARETNLAEIAQIRAKTSPELELEAFVHGAMCVSFSGRCLLSQYLVNRDANRGECAQPCRWGYYLVEEKRLNQPFETVETERGTFIMNAKDLCMIEHLNAMKEAGISSFKIEGRAKSAYYTAVITGAYRAALDALDRGEEVPQWVLCEVFTVSHREYCTGFYLNHEDAAQFYEDSGYVREYDFIGVVNDYKDGVADITQRNYFSINDEIEVIAPKSPPQKLLIKSMKNEKNEPVEIANKATERLFVECDMKLKPFSILRKPVI
ncbi:MAG: U32 family peptidase [Oscillospiraceae bacterium]|nr:U32 family peptidase [Oscillospiraceae bacterium]